MEPQTSNQGSWSGGGVITTAVDGFNWSDKIRQLGDRIAGLRLTEAQMLVKNLKSKGVGAEFYNADK